MIHDKLGMWSFGLWNECPPNVKIAWGARAIAEKSGNFSLVHDRCTLVGDESLRGEFTLALNAALPKANETCRRYMMGWDPIKDLDMDSFVLYWESRMISDPQIFKAWQYESILGLDKPSDIDPRVLYLAVKSEQKALARYYYIVEEIGDAPDPPTSCERNLYDDECDFECGQTFIKRNGKWQGCFEIDNSWECEYCGFQHPFEDYQEEPPHTPFMDAYKKIVGYQMQRMSEFARETFVIYEDEYLIIKANTNESGGYVYIIAYPK